MASGTAGYGEFVDRFFEVSEGIDFAELHECLLPFLPALGGRVLDIGAGSGRDAAALSHRGFEVVAVEALPAFVSRARQVHANSSVRWICDSLPDLARLSDASGSFDFILCHAVWQHLDSGERRRTMQRVADLLAPSGAFALGLRHGPHGMGTHYFQARPREAESLASSCGLSLALRLLNQPSAIPGKLTVTWTRLVFSKGEHTRGEGERVT